jgi:alpha-D-ribose 1-methylphosphonate 5-triphosphate diphosphatase
VIGMNPAFAVTGGRLLLASGLATSSVAVAEGRIVAVGETAAPCPTWNADGLLVLPGIVDLHGDAFERQIMPRPGVQFALDLALVDTDR